VGNVQELPDATAPREGDAAVADAVNSDR
jgi:hypothetical protein